MKILRIFFIFFSIILFSQNVENFSVSTLSQDDGLSQGSNYFRFEDSHGFMWITGNDALNRYDGENVKFIFQLDKKIDKDRITKFDNLESDGPILISKKFADLIKKIALKINSL